MRIFFLVNSLFLFVLSSWLQANTISLQQLKEKCRQSEENTQMAPFTSSFNCSQGVSFYRKVGEDQVNFSSENKLTVRASIKGDKHQTGWIALPTVTSCNSVDCPVYEQWNATARYTVTIKSCSELENITTEQLYCEQALEPVWAECQREMNDNTFDMSQGGQCEYSNLGVRKSCMPLQQEPKQEVEVESSSSSSSSSSSHEVVATSSHSSSHSSSDVMDGKCQKGKVEAESHSSSLSSSSDLTDHLLGGANFDEETVDKGKMHHSHKVVTLTSNPSCGSLLAKLGLSEGCQVSKINSRRTKSVDDLIEALDKASKRPKIVVEYRKNAEESFIKETYTDEG